MENISNNPRKRQGKDKGKRTQLQTILQYLNNHTATASMVSNLKGIPQKNITRYERDLEKVGRLWEVEKRICEHTGFRAWYLTTNPNNIPFDNQLKMF
tara:strand:- start:344 stop:637 length:294 start_codon:yes stop_codon:yes gene_type:complete